MRRTGEEGAVKMKKSTILLIWILTVLTGMCSVPGMTFALDAPHNLQDTRFVSVGCSYCHPARGTVPAWYSVPVVSDNTKINNLCKDCHKPDSLSEPTYEDVQTHSSYKTSTNYGTWVIQCNTCHDQHYQNQADSYPTEGIFSTGTVSSILVSSAVSTVTVQGTLSGSYTNYMLAPNTTYPTIVYRIKGNTANTITVWGAIDTSSGYAGAGNSYTIKYGKMIWNEIATPASGKKTTKFFNPNSFVTTTAPYTGVCQVCHTKTKYFLGNGLVIQGDHVEPATANCTDCHKHSEGFKASCEGCHGDPPKDTATLIFKTITGATVSSQSDGPGAHVAHKTAGFKCVNCHTGGMLGGKSQGDDKINIGFYLNSNLSGSYDGKAGRTDFLAPVYVGGGTTTVSANGSHTCSNIYCHSNVQSGTDGTGGPSVYSSPVWTSAGSVQCGDCHKGDGINGNTASKMDSGSHTKHLVTSVGATCDTCHSGNKHVDKSVDVAASVGYNAGGLPQNGFGTCSTASCHNTVQGPNATSGVTVTTPVWGSASGCGACHVTIPTTGSHNKHLAAGGVICGSCHATAGDGSAMPTSNHLNGNIDVANGYPTTNPIGDGNYATCTTASCHNTVQGENATSGVSVTTPVWGSSSACGACHVTVPTTGSHTKHLAVGGVICGSCHATAGDGSAMPTSNHLNGNIDVANGYPSTNPIGDNNYANCSTAACHSDGKSSYMNPQWGSSNALGCGFCHGNPPITGAHKAHVSGGTTTVYGSTVVSSSSGTYFFGCGNCHPVSASGNHMNNSVEIRLNNSDGGVLKSLNTGTASSSNTGVNLTCSGVYCHSNGADSEHRSYQTSPIWGGSFGANKCGSCHDNPPQYDGQSHYTSDGFMGKEGGHLVGIHFDNIYNGVTGTGLLTAGSTTTNSSHGNANVASTIGCNACHSGIVGSTAIDTYALNNVSTSAMKCGNTSCHSSTQQVGAIIDKSLHVNGAKNVVIAAAFSMKTKAQLRTNPSSTSASAEDWQRTNGYKAVDSYDTGTINTADWNETEKTCTTACHIGNTVEWGDKNVSCNSCHTRL